MEDFGSPYFLSPNVVAFSRGNLVTLSRSLRPGVSNPSAVDAYVYTWSYSSGQSLTTNYPTDETAILILNLAFPPETEPEA